MRSTASSAGRLGRTRARGASPRAEPGPASPARLSVLARSGGRVRAVADRPHRQHNGDEHGSWACPYGSGAHPYLTLGNGDIDDVVLRVPARTVLRSDDRGIPIGTVAVDGTELDFRSAREIGETKLDNGYTDLERDDAGIARILSRSTPGAGPLGRRGLSVRHGVHGRHPIRATSWARGRADDLSSERVPQRRRSGDARARANRTPQRGGFHRRSKCEYEAAMRGVDDRTEP